MTKQRMKMISMEIRKCLPNDITDSQACAILESLADEFRRRSRKDVSQDVAKFRAKVGKKTEDYDPLLDKDK